MALGFMRRHQRWLSVFLWLVISGASSSCTSPHSGRPTPAGRGETLAEVGGEPITVGEYQRAYTASAQQLQRMYQGRLDAGHDASSIGIREQMLHGLVEQRLVALEARPPRLAVDDEALARAHRGRRPASRRTAVSSARPRSAGAWTCRASAWRSSRSRCARSSWPEAAERS